MKSKIYLFSHNAKPKPGGIAEFTDRIALALKKRNRLGGLITTMPQVEKMPYRVFEIQCKRNKSGRVSFRYELRRKGAAVAGLWGIIVFLFWEKLRGRDPVLWFTNIHSFFSPPILRWCALGRIRIWVLFHGNDVLSWSKRKPEIGKQIEQNADKIIFNSEATRSLFCERWRRLERSSDVLYPVPDFTDLDRVVCEQLPLEIPPEAVVFSSLCRLVERKGIHLAIQAFRGLKEAGQLAGSVYYIAGDGPERSRLERLAGSERNRSIFFLGHISNGQKKTLFLRTLGFLHPNIDRAGADFEGFGITLVEAAWYGCAVLAGAQGGVPEAVKGLPGSVVEAMENPKDAEGIISEFLENTANADRNGWESETIREALVARFSFDRQLEAIIRQREEVSSAEFGTEKV